jgi:hypothetical protein
MANATPPSLTPHACLPKGHKRPEELTVKEVSQKFNVSQGVVYYWIERGYITARRLKPGLPYWITLKTNEEQDLQRRVVESYKLNDRKAEHSQSPLKGGAE